MSAAMQRAILKSTLTTSTLNFLRASKGTAFSMEMFFQFIDKAAVVPVTKLTWTEFLKKHPRRRKDVIELVNFVMDAHLYEHCPQLDEGDAYPDELVMAEIGNRTIRWCMERSDSDGYVLNTVTYMDPNLRRRCPAVFLKRFAEYEILAATAVEAYQKGLISKRMLGAVMSLVPPLGKDEFGLDKDAQNEIRGSTTLCDTRPMFDWSFSDEGYFYLNLIDTRLFRSFVLKAWEENWPLSKLHIC